MTNIDSRPHRSPNRPTIGRPPGGCIGAATVSKPRLRLIQKRLAIWKIYMYYNALLVRLDAEVEHGCTIHCEFENLFRACLDPGEALYGPRGEPRDLVQHAAQGLRIAPEAAIHLHQGRSARCPRGHRQGLRILEGPVRDLHA